MLDVHESARLQDVDQLLHVRLVTGSPKDVLFGRSFFVQLEDQDEEWGWQAVVVRQAHV